MDWRSFIERPAKLYILKYIIRYGEHVNNVEEDGLENAYTCPSVFGTIMRVRCENHRWKI